MQPESNMIMSSSTAYLLILTLSHRNKYCSQKGILMDAQIHELPDGPEIAPSHPISALLCTGRNSTSILHGGDDGLSQWLGGQGGKKPPSETSLKCLWIAEHVILTEPRDIYHAMRPLWQSAEAYVLLLKTMFQMPRIKHLELQLHYSY